MSSATEEKGAEVPSTGVATDAASSNNSGKPNGVSKKTQNGHAGANEKNDNPIMVARNKSGVVKWFSFKNGYGFITVDGDGDDIFVHRSEFIREGAREVFYHIDVGDRLEFDIINRAKGREAVAVTGPGGKRIPGSPANYSRRRKFHSEHRPRNVEEHYEDAQEDLENKNPNGESKKRGSQRGGRRRNASVEGQDQPPQQQQGANDGSEPNNKEKGSRPRQRGPRNGKGGRGGRANDEPNNGSAESGNQEKQENTASN